MPIKPLAISACTVTNALGRGINASLAALERGVTGLRQCDFEDAALNTWIGSVAGLEEEALTGPFAAFDCRNNRLARLALEQDGFSAAVWQASARYGAERIGVFLGSSTSGIRATEIAYRERDAVTGSLPISFDYRHTHNLFSVTDLTRRWLGVTGPALTVSTACSSSAKAFAVAHRQIQAGFCDAAVVGGVDSLCLTTLYGFNALGLASTEPCQPWGVGRDGLNIGESAGFALLERAGPDDDRVLLLGYGETSDAHHMSAPHPEGAGAQAAMQAALQMAGLQPQDIGYINLHGTATPANDVAEGLAVSGVFGTALGGGVPCSSTKGITGHTLGAAGALEAVACALALEHGLLPPSVGTRTPDPAIPVDLIMLPRTASLRHVLSNSFGFGGSNASLLLSRRGA